MPIQQSPSPTSTGDLERIADMVKGIEFAMLTHEVAGALVSRPMTTQKFDIAEKTIWFFASDESLKSRAIEGGKDVNVSFAEPKDRKYVSVSGAATLVHDRSKIEEFWKPSLKPWFPEGLQDPHICLISVSIDRAEFWDASSGKMVQAWALVKAFATGQKVDKLGEHKTISVH